MTTLPTSPHNPPQTVAAGPAVTSDETSVPAGSVWWQRLRGAVSTMGRRRAARRTAGCGATARVGNAEILSAAGSRRRRPTTGVPSTTSREPVASNAITS